MLINSKFPMALAEMRDMQAAARSLGLEITVLDANGESEIEAAFASLARDKVGALIINTDPLLLGHYFLREFVDAGGLMSYGPNIHNGYRQAGFMSAAC